MTLEDPEVRAAYEEEFVPLLQSEWAGWRANYLRHVERIRSATPEEWMTRSFQELLWDSDAVTTIGPGRSVTVEGAYDDMVLAESLYDAREFISALPQEERGAELQTLYGDTLLAVQPYNARRPKARLVRLLASMFPSDVSCIIEDRKLWQVLQLVGVRSLKAEYIAQHPTLRRRLREILAAPEGLDADVDQSIFSWFLWERHFQKAEEGAVLITPKSGGTDVPMLSLLPASVQRKGLVHVTGNVPLLVAVVREAEQGISRPDLVAAIQREAPHLKAHGSASNIISQAQGGLALIGMKDGAYRPTDRGLELLTNPVAEQVLQPLLIGRIFGIGQLLLALKDSPAGVEKKMLVEDLSTLIPGRRSLWSGNELVQWALSSRLVRAEGTRLLLTEDGAAYADALPGNFLAEWKLERNEESEPARLDPGGEEAAQVAVAAAKFVQADWAAVQARFEDGELSSALILPDGLLAELHAALHATGHKRFVLLSGLSGTGKTSIARAYAEAYCRALGISEWRGRYAQVAVRPDWTDPTGLLGFVNSISDPPTFQAAEALHFLLAADADRGRPYFLCLDEMNLARVEHYFAPFLSAMEGVAGTLALHGERDPVDNVQPRIAWPENLFIFGTVNMDESTHPFSDKVIDRAFTFEFWDVDLGEWENRKRAGGANAAVLDRVAPHLRAIYDALRPARRHFGYRTADEVLAYCEAGSAGLAADALIDGATLMKVLPRIRGDDSGPLAQALTALAAATPETSFPRTALKIRQMSESLKATGHARFWS
jgi:MoxR-like ATPase